MSIYEKNELILLTQKHFGWLEEKYQISIVPATSNQVDLVGDEVHLRVFFSIDLPRITYLERRSDEGFYEFDIWELLCVSRRGTIKECFKKVPENSSIYERNEIMLEVISCALKLAGNDVLMGNDAWKKEYKSDPVRIAS